MTIDDLTAAVSVKTGLDNTASSEENATMRAWAKEGTERVAMKTLVFQSLGDLVLSVGVSDYRLSSSVLAITDRQIFGDDGLHILQQTDPSTLLYHRRVGGRLAASLFALSGNDLLMIEGAPEVAETIRFTYVPAVDWTDEDVDYDVELAEEVMGGIPTWAQKAIEYYMLWQAAERDDKEKGLTIEKARAFFEEECKEIRRRIRGKQGMRLSPVRIGRSSTDRRLGVDWPLRTPGVDW